MGFGERYLGLYETGLGPRVLYLPIDYRTTAGADVVMLPSLCFRYESGRCLVDVDDNGY